MKKYKFRLSESNWIEFTQEDFDKFQNVQFTDYDGKGKIIPVTRTFDKETYQIIVPLELIEDLNDD